jgi:hypothetical protein
LGTSYKRRVPRRSSVDIASSEERINALLNRAGNLDHSALASIAGLSAVVAAVER